MAQVEELDSRYLHPVYRGHEVQAHLGASIGYDHAQQAIVNDDDRDSDVGGDLDDDRYGGTSAGSVHNA